MYPFGDLPAYPRNRWYVAAFSHEITTKPIQRTLLEVPVALYRTEDKGEIVAMYGLCPHRYYPLALGHVEGDAIVCGYHGFTFAASGKCVRIPAQGTGAGFTQPTYPVVEKGLLTWIWMGDAGKEDPSLIPDYAEFGLDQEGWATSGKHVLHLRSRSQILIDNLMDLTHLPHVHHQIKGGDSYLRARQTIVERATSLRLLQEMKSAWTPFFEHLWGEEHRYEGEATIMSITDLFGPELVRTTGPIVTDGPSDDPKGRYGDVYFLHGVTPETANSLHYFCFQTRNFRIDDEAFGQSLGAIDLEIRTQDKAATEAVEEWVEFGAETQRELLVKTDRLAVKARQRIEAMITNEMPSRK